MPKLEFDFDFFLAHADEDAGAARDLRELLLQVDLDLRIFCPSLDLELGSPRDEATRNAMKRSLVFVPLLSRHFHESKHLADDVVTAIDEAGRDGRRRIIPVYLHETSPPYGLSRLHSVHVQPRLGLKDVADQLARTMAKLQGHLRRHEHEPLPSLIALRRERASAGEGTLELDEEIRRIKQGLRRGGVIRVGDVLSERYVLLEVLGDGARGTVFRAQDEELQQTVAVKVLWTRTKEDPSGLLRWSRSLVRMQELLAGGVSGIVQVLKETTAEDGYHYAVFEYLAGSDLLHAVGERRVVPSEVVRLVVELGTSLHAIHLQGSIHGNLKPTNVIFDSSGSPKLTDFLGVGNQHGGQLPSPVGSFDTLIFCSPEALRSSNEVANVRSDVYSLAMIAAFGLNGGPVPCEAFRNPSDFLERLDCRPAVRAELARALDWNPDQRHESIESFCRSLERAQLQETDTRTAQSLDHERVRRNVMTELFGIETDPVLVHGRYQLIKRLGRGASGQVQEAYDMTLERHVALKVVAADRLEQVPQDVRARLLGEAKHLARLAHQNVVRVFDVNVGAPPYFIAMELIQGTNAAEWIDETDPSWEEILGVFIEAGTGLAAAHAHRIVHRDFKPQNVLIQRDPWRVCVTDFGLARLHTDNEVTPSGDTGIWGGTPGYMAPEQAFKVVSPRSDQFSFCVSLYKALYREMPFPISATAPMPAAPPTPAQVGEVPAWVLSVLQRGLAISPDARYATMQDVLRAIRAGFNPLYNTP